MIKERKNAYLLMILIGLVCVPTFQNFYKTETMKKASISVANELYNSEQELQTTKYEMSSVAMPQAQPSLKDQAPIRIKLKRTPAKYKSSKTKTKKSKAKKTKKKKSKSSQRP